jgi:hypothetical protein
MLSTVSAVDVLRLARGLAVDDYWAAEDHAAATRVYESIVELSHMIDDLDDLPESVRDALADHDDDGRDQPDRWGNVW